MRKSRPTRVRICLPPPSYTRSTIINACINRAFCLVVMLPGTLLGRRSAVVDSSSKSWSENWPTWTPPPNNDTKNPRRMMMGILIIDPTMISALGRYGQTRNVYNYRVKSIDSWSPIVVRLALCIRFQVEGGNFFVEREIVMRVKCHRP